MPKRTDIKKILIIGSGPIVQFFSEAPVRSHDARYLFDDLAGMVKESKS